MATQRTEAEYLFQNKLTLPEEQDIAKLRGIVGSAQNRREVGGEADGSINEVAWLALRDGVDALAKARECIKKFMETLS